MIAMETRQNLTFYYDDGILAEIWEAVRHYEVIRALDAGNFSISVKNGSVLLNGHVSRKYHRNLIEEIACSTPGVSAVQNELVVDSDLTIQVVKALSKDERTRSLILPVSCSHGWVLLGGTVPEHELQTVAEEIAAQVPSVRGVLSRPKLIGETDETERHPIQPQIQAKVYDYNTQEGSVTQVVIQPRNRLVTHAVVRTSDFQDGKSGFHEYAVPVEAMEVVNDESILLTRKGPPLNAYPAFESSEYSPASLDWQPPYPYTAENVRWPCEEREQAEKQIESQPLVL